MIHFIERRYWRMESERMSCTSITRGQMMRLLGGSLKAAAASPRLHYFPGGRSLTDSTLPPVDWNTFLPAVVAFVSVCPL